MGLPDELFADNVRSACNPCRGMGGRHSKSLAATRFLILILALFAPVPVFGLDKVRIATSSPSVGSFPSFFADKKELYRNEGLDAEIIFVRANIAITALVTDEVDFITFFGSTLRASLRGLPVRNVLVVMTGADYFLVTRPEIRDWNALRGQKFYFSTVLLTGKLTSAPRFFPCGVSTGDLAADETFSVVTGKHIKVTED